MTAPKAARPRAAPLFLRNFAMMLACVVTVQLINFALVVINGLPIPQIYTVEQVADVLKGAKREGGAVRLTESTSQPPSTMKRDETLRVALAERLNVPTGRVEVFRHILLGSNLAPFLDRAGRRRYDENYATRLFFGDFEASLRLSDGRWLIAQPAVADARSWGWRIFLILAAALIGVAPFAWWLSRRLARPIAMFAAAADRLGRNFRAAPISTAGPPEIAAAAEAFNRMQGRLERFVEDRGMLIAAVAHDMRTPLMRLSLRLSDAPDALRTAIERDIADMNAMIVAATAFIRDVREPAKRRKIDLRSLTESIVDEMADRGDPVTLDAGHALVVEAEANGLKALITNLLTNAVRYGGDATVSLYRSSDGAVLEVRDHGPGVPEADLDRVFEPFFRGERSRNRDTGGIGLGLASVRAVAQAHGGGATLTNHPDGGALAQVTLPS